jgi:hypothetical protein
LVLACPGDRLELVVGREGDRAHDTSRIVREKSNRQWTGSAPWLDSILAEEVPLRHVWMVAPAPRHECDGRLLEDLSQEDVWLAADIAQPGGDADREPSGTLSLRSHARLLQEGDDT